MLVSFAVTNFRSIREKVELNMSKSGLKGLSENYFNAASQKQLLKSAVIYGPNASGKSGFLGALKALENLVITSNSLRPGEAIDNYEPHRLEKNFSSSPVKFEITFLSEGVQYDYHIAFSSERFEIEELYFYRSGNKSLLYSRVADKEIKFGDYYRGPKKTLERLLLGNQLFLSKAAENNSEALLAAYQFFKKGLMVYSFVEDEDEDRLASLYAKRLAEDGNSNFSKRFNALICALDTGITSVSAEEVDWNDVKFPGNLPEVVKKRVQEDYKYDIKTQHPLFEGNRKTGTEYFEVRDESAGTKSLFVIGGIILEALGSGNVLVVDEFEKTLHPGITAFLIQLFHNPVVNTQNAQLIFATHDITQLTGDHFRRDQIWFTEKNEYGATSLTRCSDIPGIRINTPLDKWYATGRFGATPIINEVDFLIEMQQN